MPVLTVKEMLNPSDGTPYPTPRTTTSPPTPDADAPMDLRLRVLAEVVTAAARASVPSAERHPLPTLPLVPVVPAEQTGSRDVPTERSRLKARREKHEARLVQANGTVQEPACNRCSKRRRTKRNPGTDDVDFSECRVFVDAPGAGGKMRRACGRCIDQKVCCSFLTNDRVKTRGGAKTRRVRDPTTSEPKTGVVAGAPADDGNGLAEGSGR